MPNTVPAAGEAMPKVHTSITRRAVLGGFAMVAIPTGVAAAIEPSAEPAFDLQHWLETADPLQVAQYHAARLAAVMNEIDPKRAYRSCINHEFGFALIVGDDRPALVVRQEA